MRLPIKYLCGLLVSCLTLGLASCSDSVIEQSSIKIKSFSVESADGNYGLKSIEKNETISLMSLKEDNETTGSVEDLYDLNKLNGWAVGGPDSEYIVSVELDNPDNLDIDSVTLTYTDDKTKVKINNEWEKISAVDGMVSWGISKTSFETLIMLDDETQSEIVAIEEIKYINANGEKRVLSTNDIGLTGIAMFNMTIDWENYRFEYRGIDDGCITYGRMYGTEKDDSRLMPINLIYNDIDRRYSYNSEKDICKIPYSVTVTGSTDIVPNVSVEITYQLARDWLACGGEREVLDSIGYIQFGDNCSYICLYKSARDSYEDLRFYDAEHNDITESAFMNLDKSTENYPDWLSLYFGKDNVKTIEYHGLVITLDLQ